MATPSEGLPYVSRRAWPVLALVVAAWVATACSTTPRALREPPFENRQHGRTPGGELEVKQPYRLGLGDELKIAVRPYDEFNGTMKVDELGNIRLTYTQDKVQVLGLTLDEAEIAIVDAMAPYFQRAPRVAVTLENTESRFFYVLGAVPRPGKYRMADEHVFVREAVARAGWPLRNGAIQRTMLVSSKPDYNASRKVNLRRIIYEGNLTENYQLEDGDIVWVPYSYITEFAWRARHVLEFFNVFLDYGRKGVEAGDIAQDLYGVPAQFQGRGANNSGTNTVTITTGP
jgi:protein involved in polysaccharide export with SLBB domain